MNEINYAVVSAFERVKHIDDKRAPVRVFTLLLIVVFFIILMGGLAGGASMYSSITNIQSHNNELYQQSGLIANAVRTNDKLYSITQGEGPEGPALVLVKVIDGESYETRLYLYRGHVMEEYAMAGSPYKTSAATVLFDSKTFDFSFDGKLLSVTTDFGTSEVALRSRQGDGL